MSSSFEDSKVREYLPGPGHQCQHPIRCQFHHHQRDSHHHLGRRFKEVLDRVGHGTRDQDADTDQDCKKDRRLSCIGFLFDIVSTMEIAAPGGPVFSALCGYY